MIHARFLMSVTIILFAGCAQNKNGEPGKSSAESNDTIPAARKVINKKAIASYLTPIGDPKLDRKFGVEVFETPQTFKFLLVMYHDGAVESDTLSIPNFGIWPVVKVKPGEEDLSCIIGFLDNKNEFREYKLLAVKDERLRLSVLKQYGVSTHYK